MVLVPICTYPHLSADGASEEFDIVAGVLQGDTISPYLFIIVLDYVL